MIKNYRHSLQSHNLQMRLWRDWSLYQQKLKTLLAAVIALIIASSMLAVALTASPGKAYAQSGTLTKPSDKFYLVSTIDGLPYYLGVIARDAQGRNAYCIETGVHEGFSYTDSKEQKDSPDSRKIAYLAHKYQDKADPVIHAAIAALIKDRFESRDKGLWAHRRAYFLKDHPAVAPMMTKLWDEAEKANPSHFTVNNTYTEAHRRGVFHAQILSSSGQALAGLPLTVTLKGPGVFDKTGKKTITVTTQSHPLDITWTADGDGQVSVSAQARTGSLERLSSDQDYLRTGKGVEATFAGITFSARKSFMPEISTKTQSRTLDEGMHAVDMVTIKTPSGESWPRGLELKASGYYFDRLHQADLKRIISPAVGQSGKDFLLQLEQKGFKPSGYGKATFTESHQKETVTATLRPDGSGQAYQARHDGSFGTWVWIIARADQTVDGQSYLQADLVSDFLEPQETVSMRNRVSVESTVAEHTALTGSTLTDSITIAGFPSDHGSYSGDSVLGYSADNKYAQVYLYWSGNRSDQKNDSAYKPQGLTLPQRDSHHELVGSWTYPARNGQVRVGGGAPDAYGKPVFINATKHGYYVFVYVFKGDSRVMPAQSAYGDEWEMTRVFDHDKPSDHATINTWVSKETVQPGENFHDTAQVRGTFKDDSYVTFTVYDAVPGSPSVSARKLLDEIKVPLNLQSCTSADKTGIRTCTVVSPQVRTATAGIVYWKATLWTAQGHIIVSHVLGARHEQTTVRPTPHKPVQPGRPHKPALPQAHPLRHIKPALAQTGSQVSGAAVIAVLLVCFAGLAFYIGFMLYKDQN
ncbi:LPXTG-motif cell wall anchor domain-containing protein [Scardovia inopinata]|uniref:Uncharacterized protein n=1 Tax=Scardovia inopinata F0304 TaxID=641146 RepID=W5IID2_SCAIO|nr:cell wall anchor protein [Scardovia inopinata]EFG26615.2 hypothetical protein HMPREF9020_00240 [Scardovia inopinata F0304]SUV51733.1 LPXTG-motif cell wall anchor domain-containing protein [Scardovia inopinata]